VSSLASDRDLKAFKVVVRLNIVNYLHFNRQKKPPIKGAKLRGLVLVYK